MYVDYVDQSEGLDLEVESIIAMQSITKNLPFIVRLQVWSNVQVKVQEMLQIHVNLIIQLSNIDTLIKKGTKLETKRFFLSRTQSQSLTLKQLHFCQAWVLVHLNLLELKKGPELQYWRIKFVVTFLSRFLDSRVGLSNYRYYQSCSPGSEDSKLILHYSVALFLSILEQFQWSKKKILKQWK